MRAFALVLGVFLMAGCFSARPDDGTSDSGSANGPPGTTVTRPGTTTPLVEYGDWADPDDAEIRPGARVVVAHLACTANFLFRSPDNRSLYLGVAAHCFGLDPSDAAPIGTAVTVAGIRNAGTIAYNGWEFDDGDANDFGLVQLSNSPAIRARVSPAMMYYGGPTAMGDASNVESGTHVMTYGNSVQRDESDPNNPREGYVASESNNVLAVLTDQPGVPGDSGSGLMTYSGQAIGVLSTGVVPDASSTVPLLGTVPSINYYVEIDYVLELAGEANPALANLELVTWDLLRTPSLPTIDPPVAGWEGLPVRYL